MKFRRLNPELRKRSKQARRRERWLNSRSWRMKFLLWPRRVSSDSIMWLCTVARRNVASDPEYRPVWNYGPISNLLVGSDKEEVWR